MTYNGQLWKANWWYAPFSFPSYLSFFRGTHVPPYDLGPKPMSPVAHRETGPSLARAKRPVWVLSTEHCVVELLE